MPGCGPVSSSESWITTTRPFHITPHSIWEPGPPAALNHFFKRWMRQTTSGQRGSRHQGRPGMGVRREKLGIAAHYTPDEAGGG
ncbi:MAG: hypothetical protein ACI93G_001839 [Hyphomonas sp.]|jgi:hypothetical protein